MFLNRDIPTQAQRTIPETRCAYCDVLKDPQVQVRIDEPEYPMWCMMETTGKITCPNCFYLAIKEAYEQTEEPVPKHHIEGVNRIESKQPKK